MQFQVYNARSSCDALSTSAYKYKVRYFKLCVSCKIYKLAHMCHLSTPRKLFNMKNDQKLVTEYNKENKCRHIIFPVFKVSVRRLTFSYLLCISLKVLD